MREGILTTFNSLVILRVAGWVDGGDSRRVPLCGSLYSRDTNKRETFMGLSVYCSLGDMLKMDYE